MIWLDKVSSKSNGVFGWARQKFKTVQEQHPHLHPNELIIYTDSPDDPVIKVLTLTRNMRLSKEQCFLISDTIAIWLETNHYIRPNSTIDVWQSVYRNTN